MLQEFLGLNQLKKKKKDTQEREMLLILENKDGSRFSTESGNQMNRDVCRPSRLSDSRAAVR